MTYGDLNDEIPKSELYSQKVTIGNNYQAVIPDLLTDENEIIKKLRNTPDKATLVWSAEENWYLTDDDLDAIYEIAADLYEKYMFIKAYNRLCPIDILCTNTWAPRDKFQQYVLNAIHEARYNVPAALASLVIGFGQNEHRDELQKFSRSDKYVFERVIDFCERDFFKMKQKFMPHKSVKSLIEYYYMREKPKKKRFSRCFNVKPKRRSSADSINKEEATRFVDSPGFETTTTTTTTTIATRWRPSNFCMRVSVYFKTARRFEAKQLRLRAAARNPFRLI